MEKLFQSFKNLRVAVIGDFALDLSYNLNKNTGEFSIETGMPVTYGSSVSSCPGAAGNIVNNIISLGVENVSVFGFVGDDIFGRELKNLFIQKGVNCDSLIELEENWETYTYVKPFERKEEVSRLDFGSYNIAPIEQIHKLLDSLRNKIEEIDILIINQQFVRPMIDSNSLNIINEIVNDNPKCKVFGDLRKNKMQLSRGVLKLSVFDLSQILGIDDIDKKDTTLCIEKAREVQKRTKNQLFVIRGESGLLYADNNDVVTVPGIYLTGDMDELGKGNTCISAFAIAYGSGANIKDSLEIANLAYAIIVKKIRETGSATPEEILELAENSYYNYDLALAYDTRKAKYFEDSEIEIVGNLPSNLEIKNVIFDHDGTISTLREGWEFVMHNVMMEEICGSKLNKLPTEEYNKISLKCEKFISDTTGIQTIVQMEGLRNIVLEEAFIERSAVKTAAEYKKIYLDKLMISVNDRIKKFCKGERTLSDFILLGSRNMLSELSKRNLNIFLASGTDEENVINEATALGYGDLFTGGIRGSKGNEIGDAKKIVINRIIEEGRCEGENLMVIGDGPVEIIEGRKVGAFCIGVASDEIRRHGLNLSKRSRLIRAGANIIIPDFSQLPQLLKIIFGN